MRPLSDARRTRPSVSRLPGSPFFAALYRCRTADAKRVSNVFTSKESLQLVLEFAYHGRFQSLESIPFERLVELLADAHYLGMRDLFGVVNERTASAMYSQNVLLLEPVVGLCNREVLAKAQSLTSIGGEWYRLVENLTQ